MKLNKTHYGIILAALATTAIHFAAAFDQHIFPHGPDPLFLLNGIGYLGLLGAYFLPIPFFQKRHKLIGLAMMAFAVLTIVAWLVIWVGFYVIRDGFSFFDYDARYGIPAKLAEIILLIFLRSDKKRILHAG